MDDGKSDKLSIEGSLVGVESDLCLEARVALEKAQMTEKHENIL
jgi:hypothetical protein